MPPYTRVRQTTATAGRDLPADPFYNAATGGSFLQRRSSMKVKDVMHKGVDWVSPDTPITELARLMREHDIGSIPIGENDKLIGMVTDRDIVCKGLADDSLDIG